MNQIETGIQRFSQGYNCAQSVFTVFATEYGLDLRTARQITALFGGGIARSGELCGAISGGLMALGLHLATFDPTENEKKDRLYRLGQDFIERFRKRFGEINCRHLINRELHTPQLHHATKESGVFENLCPQYVSFSIATIAEIFEEERKIQP